VYMLTANKYECEYDRLYLIDSLQLAAKNKPLQE